MSDSWDKNLQNKFKLDPPMPLTYIYLFYFFSFCVGIGF